MRSIRIYELLSFLSLSLKINKVALFSGIICQLLVSLTTTQCNNTVIIMKASIIINAQQY